MEPWRDCWRRGVVPNLTTHNLEVLRDALVRDDPRLIQGASVMPPGAVCSEWPVEAACAIAYCAWQSDGLDTVYEAQEFFGRMCLAIDDRLGEPASCRFFLNAYDEWPRKEMRALLLPEVEMAITERKQQEKQDAECN